MNEYGYHRPAMTSEVCRFLVHRPDGLYVDSTVGGGGHARAILDLLSEQARLIGIDRDPEAIEEAGKRLGPFRSRVTLVRGLFSEVDRVCESLNITSVTGILFDLGVSSRQLDSAGRGFSFREDGPLDMRMDPDQKLTAGQVVNSFSEKQLADLIFQYGEERKSRSIARAIERYRRKKPIETTGELAELIRRTVGWKKGKIDPSTRSFQALRMYVNRELDELQLALDKATGLLEPGGTIVVLSYHSLEDRMVKWFFRADGRLLSQTKKPVFPGDEEIQDNPRSRSARLRAAVKSIDDEGEKS